MTDESLEPPVGGEDVVEDDPNRGVQGVQGIQGIQGRQGEPATGDGKQGIPGLRGKQGVQGQRGESGYEGDRPLVEVLDDLGQTLLRLTKTLDDERRGRRIGMAAIYVAFITMLLFGGLGWRYFVGEDDRIAAERCHQINETRADTRQAFTSAFDEALSQVSEDSPETRKILMDMDDRVARDLPQRECS